jgi:hypothetical protein
MGKAKYAVERGEARIPMEVAVQIAGHPEVPGLEMTFTENVSTRGARVITSRRWRPNDRLMLASLPGNFQSLARVAYCEPRRGEGYAVGLEFLRPSGRWVINPPSPVESGPQAA